MLDRPPVSLERAVLDSLYAEGNIKLSSKRLIFLSVDKPMRLIVKFENGSSRELEASLLVVKGSKPLKARLKSLKMTGLGFYANITAGGEIRLSGERISAIVIEERTTNRYTVLEELRSLVISCDTIMMMVREPYLEISGRALLRNVYVRTWIQERAETVLRGLIEGRMPGSVLRVRGRDVELRGLASLSFYMGGGPMALDMEYRGEVTIKPPLVTWNDVDSLLRALPFS